MPQPGNPTLTDQDVVLRLVVFGDERAAMAWAFSMVPIRQLVQVG